MNEDNRTMEQLGQEALLVQDASNLSGVVHSFSRAISRLRVLLREQGMESTEAVNTHPVCVLFSSKIASLTNSESMSCFHSAYKDCARLSHEM